MPLSVSGHVVVVLGCVGVGQRTRGEGVVREKRGSGQGERGGGGEGGGVVRARFKGPIGRGGEMEVEVRYGDGGQSESPSQREVHSSSQQNSPDVCLASYPHPPPSLLLSSSFIFYPSPPYPQEPKKNDTKPR